MARPYGVVVMPTVEPRLAAGGRSLLLARPRSRPFLALPDQARYLIMHRRKPRLLRPAVLVAAGLVALGVPSPATAHRGKVAAASAPGSAPMRVSTNRPLLPTSDPIYGRDA